ncbi:MAG: M23 family metallopeptidase [Deltaproteobacteria bacterium]|nr:M23 family metallopeptidase [Deltaproteobacteria bacterium]
MRFLAIFLTLVSFFALTTALKPSRAQDTPWNRRVRTGVVLNDSPAVRTASRKGPLTADEMRRLGLRPRGGGLIDLSYWPQEPAAPSRVLPSDLAATMAQLCPASTKAQQLGTYARAIVRSSEEFSVDPWMLAALVYTQSNCDHEVRNSYGAGLTLINRGMHAANIRDGVYRFGDWTDRGWAKKELDVSAFPFRRDALVRPEANIYFAAAILNVFAQQCPHIDGSFDSVSHRHAVSHFIWGDRVSDTGPEDRILTARRRLLSNHARRNRAGGGLLGISFVSPLDGYPRIATSGLGEPRDGGRRPHRGIDFASEEGEPVRSIARGTVTFAGVDWERRAQIALEPWGAAIVHERHMGPRGLFVKVDHGNGVASLYAHLASYDVQIGDQIEAGQRLGQVGRTGIKDSGAHLHFGLFQNSKVLDPLEHLAEYVFPPTLTKRGHAELTKRRRRRR